MEPTPQDKRVTGTMVLAVIILGILALLAIGHL
jgi:hypothetical protein